MELLSSDEEEERRMELLSSDEEEERPMEFWNNWMPPTIHNCSHQDKHVPFGIKTENTRKVVFSSRTPPVIPFTNSKFGNWIPPLNFFNGHLRNPRNEKQFHKEEEVEVKTVRQVSESWTQKTSRTIDLRKVNLDWGERRELHDVMKMNMGDLFWGVVNLGIFAKIKVWVNEYGNVCCLASGKITKAGSSEMTFISITNTQLLRKMLNISSAQWASLCETIIETKVILKFDAFQDCDLKRKTSVERLWFFICKRRHFLPNQCMLVKFCGAIKCMREFNITPKLLVQDIRNISGEPIL